MLSFLFFFYMYIETSAVNEWKSLIKKIKEERLKVSKSKRSGAGSSQVYQSCWPHYNALYFVKDHLSPALTISNLESLFKESQEEEVDLKQELLYEDIGGEFF